MPDSYVKQNFSPIRMQGNKSDIFLEISPITNINSTKYTLEGMMGYPTQFSMSEKLNKEDIEYHTSVLYDEILIGLE